MKRAFTLVELMTASVVGIIVLTAVGSTFMSALRMLATAMADTELSLSAREIRERLLFRAAPVIDGVVYAGILSGTNSSSIVEGGATPNIQMSCPALGETFADRPAQSMRIMLTTDSDGSKYLFNERMPEKERHRRWLRPGGFSLKDGRIADIVGVLHPAGNPNGIYRLSLDVNLSYGMRYAGGEVVRRERVSAPALGKAQPMSDAEGY